MRELKRTPIVPGKPVVMKTREDEEELLMEWINIQTTYSDSIRYLIQKEIAENGLRNFQEFIPQFRTIDGLRSQLQNNSTSLPSSNYAEEKVMRPQPVSSNKEQTMLDEIESPSSQEYAERKIVSNQPNEEGNVNHKRPAAKKFDANVAKSFAN